MDQPEYTVERSATTTTARSYRIKKNGAVLGTLLYYAPGWGGVGHGWRYSPHSASRNSSRKLHADAGKALNAYYTAELRKRVVRLVAELDTPQSK